jgi:hypothetical protein
LKVAPGSKEVTVTIERMTANQALTFMRWAKAQLNPERL